MDLVLGLPDGRLRFHKQLADPADLAGSVLEGVRGLARQQGLDPREMLAGTASIAHGTTIATNAVLTRTGAPTALLTTAGLRDALEMRRGVKEEVFDLRYRAPEPLAGRDRRYAVDERIGFDGTVLRPLDPDPVIRQLAPAVEGGEVQAVAVCLAHAWIADRHERALADRLRRRWPALHVACSCDVLNQIGFYDRLSTTVATAYTAPLLSHYLGSLARRLSEAGFGGRLFVISSAGGLLTPGDAVAQSARTVLSGPAAAPVAGARLCSDAGLRDAAVVDMGGTSFDVSLVRDGAPVASPGGQVGGVRIALPMTDVRTIPLGGGSIAWLDEGGLLRLGPRSAGASPGPACFGRGGLEPTITDADLVLGYLEPRDFSDAGVSVDRVLAEQALARGLAAPPLVAAVGVRRLAATRMADAVMRTALEGGLDHRRLPLVVGGGAGPVHACAIGAELEADRLLVPAGASTLCAIGALLLRPRYDAVRGLFGRLGELTPAAVAEACDALADALAATTGRCRERLTLAFAGDLRYAGQEQSLPVELSPARLRQQGLEPVHRAFEQVHQRRYGYLLEAADVEILGVRATASWDLHTGRWRPEDRSALAGGLPPTTRNAYDPSTGSVRPFAVVDGGRLRSGDVVDPPALIRLVGSTCVVTPPYRAAVDGSLNLILTREGTGRG